MTKLAVKRTKAYKDTKRKVTLWTLFGIGSVVLGYAYLAPGLSRGPAHIQRNNDFGEDPGLSGFEPRFLSLQECIDDHSDDFCVDECDTDDTILGACCQIGGNLTLEEATQCLTRDGNICPFEDLCLAELVPGSNTGAQCLAEFEKRGGVALHLFLMLYLFLGLAIVCDDYFTDALNGLANLFNMDDDVQGATFAAVGSSAPELFVSIADNLLSNPPKSVGVGTIVGSAIVNILIIIGGSALMAGKLYGSAKIDWWPLMRDSMFYIISIIGLIWVALTGNEATSVEGFLLMLVYGLYILFMVYNKNLKVFAAEKFGWTSLVEKGGWDTLRKAFGRGGSFRMLTKRISIANLEEVDYSEPYFSRLFWPMYEPESKQAPVEADVVGGEKTEPENVLENIEEAAEKNSQTTKEKSAEKLTFAQRAFGGGIKMWGSRIYWVLVLPINLLFTTIPNSNYDLLKEDTAPVKEDEIPRRPKLFWLQFFMCIIHIGILSHLLVYSASKFGCLVGIPPSVMGLTILAAGTSVPDFITSILLVKESESKVNGAVANAIGSNVFNILMGLGFPWFLAGFIYGGSALDTGDLGTAIAFLFAVVIVFLCILLYTKFHLNFYVGITMVGLYVGYVIYELSTFTEE